MEELNLRYTSNRAPDGVKVLLPNAGVLSSPLENLTVSDHRRSDLTIGVAYGSDLEGVRALAVRALAVVPEVHGDPAPEAWVDEAAASWVSVRLRFWHDPATGDGWWARSAGIVAVLAPMDSCGVVMPFERTVVDLMPPTTARMAPGDAAQQPPTS